MLPHLKVTVKQTTRDGLLSPQLRALIDLVRPFTLLAPLFGGIFGCLIAIKCFGLPWSYDTLGHIVYVAVTLMFLNAGSNTLNQWSDIREDRVNKPYRPLVTGLVKMNEAYWIGVFFFGIAIFRALLVGPMFAMFVCLIALFSFTYSLGPRIKSWPLFGNLWIGIPRGALGLLAAFSAFAWPPNPMVIGVTVFLVFYTTGAITTKDIPDMKGDKKAGVVNLVTGYGVKMAMAISAIVIFCGLGLLYLMLVPHWQPMVAVCLVGSVVTVLMFWINPRRDTAAFENSPAWVAQYITIMMVFIFLYVFV